MINLETTLEQFINNISLTVNEEHAVRIITIGFNLDYEDLSEALMPIIKNAYVSLDKENANWIRELQNVCLTNIYGA